MDEDGRWPALHTGEDDHHLRQHQAAQNLTLVRKMALNLLQQDPTKRSIRNKREGLA